MLASNFKTAEELGLVPEALQALIKVLGLLERGEVTWTPYNKPRKNGFNMAPVWMENSCGTVGCIAGWVMHLQPGFESWEKFSSKPHDPSLEKLFCPNERFERTVEEAAHALRTYLVTGEPEWK